MLRSTFKRKLSGDAAWHVPDCLDLCATIPRRFVADYICRLKNDSPSESQWKESRRRICSLPKLAFYKELGKLTIEQLTSLHEAFQSHSKLRGLVLRPVDLPKHAINQLWYFHQPCGFTQDEFSRVVMTLPAADIQQLWDAMALETDGELERYVFQDSFTEHPSKKQRKQKKAPTTISSEEETAPTSADNFIDAYSSHLKSSSSEPHSEVKAEKKFTVTFVERVWSDNSESEAEPAEIKEERHDPPVERKTSNHQTREHLESLPYRSPKTRSQTKLALKSPGDQIGKASQDFPIYLQPVHNLSLRASQNLSSTSFPQLDAHEFGLKQEQLADNPFQLLMAVNFFGQARKEAFPIFLAMMRKYPTATDVVKADVEEIAAMIKPFGLQNQKAETMMKFAKTWIADPPSEGKRFRTLHYPFKGAGKGLKRSEVVPNDRITDGAWEIGHLPGCGPLAFDSWRVFCRDVLRGLAQDFNGKGACPAFTPEWQRVLPTDKELKAFLKWMWLREGWNWNPFTGDKEIASPELLLKAQRGEVTSGELGLTRKDWLTSDDDHVPMLEPLPITATPSDDMTHVKLFDRETSVEL